MHALQNHDELTYELVHWSTGHRDDIYTYKGDEITGEDLGDSVRSEITEQLTGADAPYNLVFTTNGIACTTATVIAATLGITDLDTIETTTSTGSGARTCCWRCSTRCSPGCSRCRAGICAAC